MPNPLHSQKYQKVIKQLRKARLEAGFTQLQVAKKLKRHQSYVSKIEIGERRIDVAELSELAEIYGKRLDYFV